MDNNYNKAHYSLLYLKQPQTMVVCMLDLMKKFSAYILDKDCCLVELPKNFLLPAVKEILYLRCPSLQDMQIGH